HGVVQVVGRLRDGVMLQRARSDVQDLASSTVAEQPGRIDAPVVTVRPFAESFLGRGTVARIMLLVVSFVLVIASANAANLLMGRALGRRKEVAVRLALGGSRWRIRLRFRAEAGVLACVGVAAGVCLAWLGVRWFDRA